jgi:benzoylsuccinyl-CoA thiolase BbsB subunit
MSDFLAYLSGVGHTPFTGAATETFEELGQAAIEQAITEADLEFRDIDMVLCGTGYGGALAGQRIAGTMGISGRPIMNYENACSSGSTAVSQAVQAVRAGRARNVVVVGIDKLSSLGKGPLPLSSDDPEVQQGVIMPAVYAMRAQRYLAGTEATPDDLAAVAAKARRNGARNNLARQQSEVTAADVLGSRPVATPLTLLMCCPRADGAAAVVVSAEPRRKGDRPAVGIRSIAFSAGEYTSGYRDMTRSALSEALVAQAYREAGLGPADMQLAEVHDAFAIAELIYYEALGFAKPGEGWRLIREGATEVTGRIPVNPGGGLIARGHPIGATGTAQMCEVYWQITGQAGDRQVAEVHNAITHCTGGGIAGFDHGACTVTVLGAA